MNALEAAIRKVVLREAGTYSSAAIDAAAMHAVAGSMLNCMAHEAVEEEQLKLMQRAYSLWMRAAGAEAKEIGTDGDTTRPSLYYESKDEGGNLGSVIKLQERAVKADGTVPVKIIKPGWGSAGYYGDKLLETDGPKAFPKGTKMFWDHPTETEARERPERSLKDLAAELVADAKYDKNGPDGPGLYAPAKVFEAYKGPIDELATHIGTSIRAYGGAHEGEAEGRKGNIIDSIIPSVMNSIDFVTLPGAGGQIVSIFEAARGRHTDADPSTPIQEATVPEKTETTGTPPEQPPADLAKLIQEAVGTANAPILQQLQESRAEVARLQERQLLRDARDIVTLTINGITGVPDMTKTRLIETLSSNPPVKDGAIDVEAFKTKITESVQSELAYLRGAAGTSFPIRNMGGGADPGGTQPPSLEESRKELDSAFGALGLSETARKVAVDGRAN